MIIIQSHLDRLSCHTDFIVVCCNNDELFREFFLLEKKRLTNLAGRSETAIFL